ncbi:MAG: hypothetical protein JST22_06245 [Bacteroidetes bacterium]|nr:hypothetical protein [Bacteroidota bacterium]
MHLLLCLLIGITLTTGLAAQTSGAHPTEAGAAGSEPFRRANRPFGVKLGYAGPDWAGGLGVGFDAILFNHLGLEASTTITRTSARVRWYPLNGAASPFLGAGAGFAITPDGSPDSWREVLVGFEHAFRSGIVLQVQLVSFVDARWSHLMRYTISPGIGFRL